VPDVVHTRRDGLDAITLAAGDLEATFAPGAGMVCCSLRHAGEEVLAQRDGLRAYAEKGKTMGIPLLYPWANRLAGWSYEALGRSVDLHRLEGGVVKADGETGLPIHGALPGPWRLVEAAPNRIAAEQHPTWEPGFRAAFPFDHRIRLDAELSPGTLRIAATVTAADARVPVAFGFHPYLTLPGVARADYELELPAMRRLELDAQKIPTGAGEPTGDLSGPLGDRTFDDGFDELDGGAFSLSGGGRRIELDFESGFAFAQVFSPPGRDLICFEPMTAPTNALRTGSFAIATPREPYTAAFSVSVSAV
jgi:galactose mutarotase-like enzyme